MRRGRAGVRRNLHRNGTAAPRGVEDVVVLGILAIVGVFAQTRARHDTGVESGDSTARGTRPIGHRRAGRAPTGG